MSVGRGILWHGDAWDEYREWQQSDKAILKRINTLSKDARHNLVTASANLNR